MEKENKNLQVFGYGISILVPAMVIMRTVELRFFYVLLVIISIFFVLSKLEKLKLLYYLLLIAIFSLAIKLYYGSNYNISYGKLIWFGLSIIFFVITFINADLLKPVYDKWMLAAHFIGNIITTIVMIVVFFCIFAPIGILFRIIGKDHLNRNIEPQKKTYWDLREKKKFDKISYTKQF